MGHFYNGAHYSTQSSLGPNEKFGKEDDMSFHDFAQNLEKKAENSSNLPQNVVVNDISNSINNYTVEELLEMLKTQKKLNSLKNENKQSINEKNELIEHHKNILSIKSQNEKELKEQNEKLLSEIKKLKSGMPTLECDVNHNITIVGGKSGKYTDGVYIESFDGKYGQIFKFSINLKRFSQNNRVTPKGYIYFEEKKITSRKILCNTSKIFQSKYVI